MRHLLHARFKTTMFVLASVLYLLGFSISSIAHSGGHTHGSLREWHLNSGRHLHASFHSFRGDSAVLELASGRLIVVSVTALRQDDASYAKSVIDRIKEINAHSISQPASDNSSPTFSNTPDSFPVAKIELLWIFTTCGAFVLALIAAFYSGNRNRIVVAASILAGLSLSAFVTNPEIVKSMFVTDPLRIDSTYRAFKPHVSTRWDSAYFYVENDGMPSSLPAMVGISSWQQQVPIPQAYKGTNAWSIPLRPEYAAVPVATDKNLFTGAIALGVNGIPVFNSKNNRGEYSFDIGELDAFGGHCGRADDYHYHIAPVHLQSVVGKTKPIAWALDGFAVFGELEPDSTTMQTLDANLGHEWRGEYHYHAVKTRPYLIAALKGKVTVQNDQIMPQAQTKGVRPFLQPLKGAVITDFHKCDSNHYALKYTVDGKPSWVNYYWDDKGNYIYNFVDEDGNRRTETYKRK